MIIKIIVLIASMLVAGVILGVINATAQLTLSFLTEKIESVKARKEDKKRKEIIRKGREKLWAAYIRLLLD